MYAKSDYVELQTRAIPPTPDGSANQIPHSKSLQARPWKSGLRRVPVLGLTALLGTLLCTAASVYILLRSDGQPVEIWHPLQPTVYLAVFSSVANILHAFALGEGLVVAWWQRAVKATTLQNLHYTWHSGTSVKGALMNVLLGREILMAVACLLTTLSIARGPLFQRASSVHDATISLSGTVKLHMAQELQRGFAGVISGRTPSPSFMTPEFTKVVQDYYKGEPMHAINSGCPLNTTCSTNVPGFGFGVHCNETKIPFTLVKISASGGVSVNTIDSFVSGAGYQEIYGFGGSQELDEDFKPLKETSNTALILNNTYLADTATSDPGAVGYLRNRVCALRGGIVSYSVTVSNGTLLSLRSSSWKDDTFLEDRGLEGIQGTTISNLAGFYLAANYLFTSSASLSFGGGVGWIMNIDGLTAAQYSTSANTSSGFNTVWTDPTDDMIDGMREIAFRTGLQIGKNTSYPNSVQQVQYTGQHQQTVYRTDHRFTVAAAAVSILGIAAVLPTFSGFTRLGRGMTLSPLEVAKAFNAPALQDVAGNLGVDAMLDDANRTKLQYGEMSYEYFQEGSSVVHKLAMVPVGGGSEPRKGVLYI
ncbi:hypothetical protein H2200_005232 [Cladophialophora chaetospira]|uniref:Uncharacterized protein n=1 Tax=Cladophialophora chaetospira TaxID=386627 RepID=A0AA39CJF2_9EURO|nr:hypothetical protein H2200_005232 [Cladophialophora chaetospira]